VTQNVYGKSWREERVDAVAQAVEAVTNAAQNAGKEEKENQAESVSNDLFILCRPHLRNSLRVATLLS